MCTGGVLLNMAIHFFNEFGGEAIIPIYPDRCETKTYNLTDRNLYAVPTANAFWAGKITRLEIFRGGVSGANTQPVPQSANVDVDLDWVRLHRADAPATPVVRTPIPLIITPNAEGGADYATVSGNPWDFSGPNDIGPLGTGDLAGVSFRGGDMFGQTVGNDSFIDLPLPVDFNPDR
jgi:hypothetical protein